uniref:Histone-lysine N-methyltransferase n=1 Tax=Syphacia muris TaxID=451379 RepID=A0A0N5AHQ1_9BILA
MPPQIATFFSIFPSIKGGLLKKSLNIEHNGSSMVKRGSFHGSLEDFDFISSKHRRFLLRSCGSHLLKSSVLRVPCARTCDAFDNKSVLVLESDGAPTNRICKESFAHGRNKSNDDTSFAMPAALELRNIEEPNKQNLNNVETFETLSSCLKDTSNLSLKRKIPFVPHCSDCGNDIFSCTLNSRKSYLSRSLHNSTNSNILSSELPVLEEHRAKYPTAIGSKYITDYASSDEEETAENSINLVPDRFGYYTVERVLAERKGNKKVSYYYIKWVGWSHRYDTWEPKENLGRVEYVMKKFRAREEALSCIVHKKGVCSDFEHLRQLRNLARWEKDINDKLKLSHQRGLYVYNDISEDLKPKNFTYITSNILPKSMKPFSIKVVDHFCKCSDGCGKSLHCCPELAGYKNFYTMQGSLKQIYCKDQGKVVECNDRCSCSIRCPTRVLQRGRRNLVAIARTLHCGWGVFALEKIPENRFVVEYVGEVLSPQDARKRKDPYYQFEVSEDGQISYVIDAKNFGNESAFINHSCDPNLVAVPVYVERMIPGYHRIGFFALRDIERGEELTLDYFNNPNEESNYIRDEDGIKCCCGTKCCKGYFPQILSEELSPKKSKFQT